MLHETVPLGRIAGIRIGAHWSVLVTIGLFAWILGTALSGTGSDALVWTLAILGAVTLFVALLAHELAHSIVARHNGLRIERIVIWLLGGASELSEEPHDPRADLRIALAGPATSLAIAAVAFGAATIAAAVDPGGSIAATLVWLAVMNTVLGLFNLLPGAPLDGGRVLRAVIWWRTGDRLRAATLAARGGQILGAAFLIMGIAEIVLFGQFAGLWPMLLGWFLRTAASAELTVAGLRHQLGDTRIRDVMTGHPMTIPAAMPLTELLRSPIVYSGHRVFPVVDPDGGPTGVLAWSDVAAVPERARATVTSGGVARRVPAAAIAHPGEPLADLASRIVLRPNLDAVLVIDDASRLVGMLTATDIVLACDRSALGLPTRNTQAPNDLRQIPDSRALP